jgi:hypothetical protein
MAPRLRGHHRICFSFFLFENGRTDLCYALVFNIIQNETTAEEVGSVK